MTKPTAYDYDIPFTATGKAGDKVVLSKTPSDDGVLVVPQMVQGFDGVVIGEE